MNRNAMKAAALVLTSAMVFGSVGCNKQNNAKTDEKGRPTITFQTIDFEGSPLSGDHADEVVAKMEDYTNTHVEFTWVANDVLSEKVSLALANPSTMPMIMAIGSIDGAIVSAAEQGAFVDLSKYIYDKEKYPNLSQSIKAVNDTCTVNGQLIGVYRARTLGRNGLGYRTDWAEAVGITEEPKTIDDVYDLFYKFTYGDPDGNGKDDTYALELCSYTGPFDVMQTWFGVGNGWYENAQGELRPVFEQPEYFEALDWFKKLYDEGLIANDWAVRGTDTWNQDVKNGVAGAFCDVLDGSRRIWDYFVNNDVKSVTNPDEPAAMTLVGTINDHTLATSGYNGLFVLSASTCDTEEKIEACLHFLDKMCDDEMITLSSYGLEGIHWHLDENGYLIDDDKEDAVASKAYAALNQTVAYIPNLSATSPTVEQSERVIKQNEVYASNIPYAVVNPALGYLNNSSTYSIMGSTLDDIIKVARTQYICGEITKTQLEEQIASWYTQGGNDVIAEVNAQYVK